MAPQIRTAGAVYGLLCVISLLNYVDRGIIPGAPIEFQAFVQQTHGVAPEHVSVYIGLLVSAFIASYSISICIFGYLSMRHRPFQLAAIGLGLWVLALVLCGLAKTAGSFYLLLLGRLLSGVGESSFHATTPAFVDEFAPPGKRTLWLGFFYSGMSAGTALGYSYGSLLARTLGWDVAFYLLALLMLPLVYACYAMIPPSFNEPFHNAHARLNDVDSRTLSFSTPLDRPSVVLLDTPTVTATTEARAIVSDLVFFTASLGLAAYAFTVAGLGAFAPSILIGYGLLPEAIASTVFGLIAILGGLIGSPLGGLLLDRSCAGHDDDDAFRVHAAAKQMAGMMALGVGSLFASLATIHMTGVFFVCLAFGLLCLFSTTAATTVVILLNVPKARRGFAMGLSTLVLHLFGDVPSPIVLGALKDAWAPHCGSVVANDGSLTLDPLCSTDRDGLTKTLTFAYAWLLFAVGLWSATVLLAKRRVRAKTADALEATPLVPN
ncbi:hypothetical protein SPRG_02291 [Saprolegnia parasitica CBS 223.65]|uniref:Major facilitator superfamily (MFS) profile domain-containing protein n=1 Tax=Saprolegnia parasitica (strain CBS 223.65) TaxID=695850 RepID=A0A067CSH5_SAPPC|nr:hypothetical protein SPRG_02291 [Saprolegnia parasitica CBS 223.65]KDO33483.1 hypothetical protein SPRG_02291 [Saprolegnia parasitica CBS 223.65]|eukprot:XP_012196227.1 hypothetical protein SPRG_02291 [Saprolegnia parasitica CBS 223.65]